ncbi:unnamed protein product, partial [Symbiodinium microadriaticum]
MNVAALMSGFMVDAFVIGLPDHVAIGETSWTGIRLLIMSCTVGNVTSVLITFFCTRDIKMLEDDEVMAGAERVSNRLQDAGGEDGGNQIAQSTSPLHTKVNGGVNTAITSAEAEAESMDETMSTFEPKKAAFITVLKELLASPTFRRFTVLILILVNLRSIF